VIFSKLRAIFRGLKGNSGYYVIILIPKSINSKNNKYLVFPKVFKHYNYIYAGVALDALDSQVQPLSRAAARSSLHVSPKFFICSLRSGELPTKVRRAFPATFLISGEFRFHPKVRLVVVFTGTSFFS
jgi:hypothetical protein